MGDRFHPALPVNLFFHYLSLRRMTWIKPSLYDEALVFFFLFLLTLLFPGTYISCSSSTNDLREFTHQFSVIPFLFKSPQLLLWTVQQLLFVNYFVIRTISPTHRDFDFLIRITFVVCDIFLSERFP